LVFILRHEVKCRSESNCGRRGVRGVERGAVLLRGTASSGKEGGRPRPHLSVFLPADPWDGLLFEEESKLFRNESWDKKGQGGRDSLLEAPLAIELTLDANFPRQLSHACNRSPLSWLYFPYAARSRLIFPKFLFF
jgi:hypothetical protein